ncbi:MAG: radical SAM protein, partial [Gemmatirosa sp.]
MAAAPHVECAARSTYASPRPGVALHRTADGGTLVVPTRRAPGATGAEPRVGAEFVRHDALHADGYLIDYLALLDGARPRAAIDAEFAGRYGPLFGPMLAERAWDWAVAHPALVDVLPRPLPQPRRAPLTGSPDGFYPLHCSFEIIETCNFTCAHCYYNAAPWKTGRVSLGDARAILDALAANGVRVVELTGGECTVHPDFPEILRHAAATFDLVGIITNGYRVGTHDRTCDAVVATPNVAVQV